MFLHEWLASTDPSDKTGAATFQIGEFEFALRLDSFSDCMAIREALEAAFDKGKTDALNLVRAHVIKALDAADLRWDPPSFELGGKRNSPTTGGMK